MLVFEPPPPSPSARSLFLPFPYLHELLIGDIHENPAVVWVCSRELEALWMFEAFKVGALIHPQVSINVDESDGTVSVLRAGGGVGRG